MGKLTLRRTWSDGREDDWTVVHENGRSLARIYRDKSSSVERWIWSVNGFQIPQTGDMRGMVPTFEAAKEAARPVIERLLAANTPLMPQPAEWKRGGLL